MDHRQLVRSLAAGRVAIGAALLIVPGLVGERWIGDAARNPAVKVLGRALGVRDLALGLGTLWALERGEPVRPWVQLGVVADTVDAVASLLATPAIGTRRALPVVAIAGTAAATGAASVDRLD